MNAERIAQGMAECIAWAETLLEDGDTFPRDTYGITGLDGCTVETAERLRRVADAFIAECERRDLDPSEYGDDERIGHDLWLTMAGHGAGFWDGDYGEMGDALTDAVHETCGRNVEAAPEMYGELMDVEFYGLSVP